MLVQTFWKIVQESSSYYSIISVLKDMVVNVPVDKQCNLLNNMPVYKYPFMHRSSVKVSTHSYPYCNLVLCSFMALSRADSDSCIDGKR